MVCIFKITRKSMNKNNKKNTKTGPQNHKNRGFGGSWGSLGVSCGLLVGSWGHLGPLGPQEPTWHPKSWFADPSGTPILELFWGPSWPISPKVNSQDIFLRSSWHKLAPSWFKLAQVDPKLCQLGSKMAPDSVKNFKNQWKPLVFVGFLTWPKLA